MPPANISELFTHASRMAICRENLFQEQFSRETAILETGVINSRLVAGGALSYAYLTEQVF